MMEGEGGVAVGRERSEEEAKGHIARWWSASSSDTSSQPNLGKAIIGDRPQEPAGAVGSYCSSTSYLSLLR